MDISSGEMIEVVFKANDVAAFIPQNHVSGAEHRFVTKNLWERNRGIYKLSCPMPSALAPKRPCRRDRSVSTLPGLPRGSRPHRQVAPP